MTKKKRNYFFYLDDMLSSMHHIQNYTKDMDFEEFKNSRITIDAVIRNFEIIGGGLCPGNKCMAFATMLVMSTLESTMRTFGR